MRDISSMFATFGALGPWAWIIAGAVLLATELAVPGAFMMWLGIAAVLVGALSFVVDWSWQLQCIAFAVFAAASVPLWRRFALKVEPQSEAPLLNRRTEALIGRVFTLEKPIVEAWVRCASTTRSGGSVGPTGRLAAGSRSRKPTARISRLSPRADRAGRAGPACFPALPAPLKHSLTTNL